MRRTDWIIKRLFYALVTVFVVITFNFLLFRVMPGDAVANLSRVPHATPELRQQIAKQFGLDQPIWKQYLIYLQQLFHGNLGISYKDQNPVSSELWTAFKHTIPMVTLATAISIVLGVASGIFSAWRRGTASEKVNQLTAMTFYSMPTQWLGLMFLFVFAATLGWLPSGGMKNEYLNDPAYGTTASWSTQAIDVMMHMILPAMTLALVLYGEYTLLVRSALLETLGEDYVLTAKAKGLGSRAIMVRHAFRNATLPVITLIALSIGSIAAGSILVESVFSWPGIGLATYQAVTFRDYPMLQGAFLIITISVIFFNLIADLLYFRLDPRITE